MEENVIVSPEDQAVNPETVPEVTPETVPEVETTEPKLIDFELRDGTIDSITIEELNSRFEKARNYEGLTKKLGEQSNELGQLRKIANGQQTSSIKAPSANQQNQAVDFLNDLTETDLGDPVALKNKLNSALTSIQSNITQQSADMSYLNTKNNLIASHPRLKGMSKEQASILYDSAMYGADRANQAGVASIMDEASAINYHFGMLSGEGQQTTPQFSQQTVTQGVQNLVKGLTKRSETTVNQQSATPVPDLYTQFMNASPQEQLNMAKKANKDPVFDAELKKALRTAESNL